MTGISGQRSVASRRGGCGDGEEPVQPRHPRGVALHRNEDTDKLRLVRATRGGAMNVLPFDPVPVEGGESARAEARGSLEGLVLRPLPACLDA